MNALTKKPVAPILAGVLGAILAMLFFWLLTIPRAGESGMGATIDPADLAPQGALPAISITTLDGNTHTTESLRGKVAVLHFWGTTCPPCVGELPALRESWRDELKDMPDLAFLAIANDQDRRILERFMQARGVEWPVAATTDEATLATWSTLNVEYTPSTVIVDPQGQIRWTGSKLPENLPAIVKALASE